MKEPLITDSPWWVVVTRLLQTKGPKFYAGVQTPEEAERIAQVQNAREQARCRDSDCLSPNVAAALRAAGLSQEFLYTAVPRPEQL